MINNKIKVTFTCDDLMDLRRLTKADDMAYFIFDLVYNFDSEKDSIKDLLNEYDINIDDLTE